MENKEKKSNFSLRRLIYNDKYLIIVSLILAVVIWIGTSLNVGTAESKTITVSAPITLSDEISEQLGMKYFSLQDSVDIKVTISGAKYVIGQVTDNDLKVTFDTSNVNRTGQQNIPILVSNASRNLDFDVVSTYPSSVEGFFDVSAVQFLEPEVIYDETNVADGYIFGNPVLSESSIMVSGPKTYIDRIEKARLNIHFGEQKDLTQMFKEDCEIELVGNDIEQSYLTITSTKDSSTPIKEISVKIPVLKKSYLPVSVDFVDKPAGFNESAIRVRYSTQNVNAGVLDSTDIESAVIGSINFNEIGVGTQTFEFNVSKLNGIKILDDTKTITATVTLGGTYTKKDVVVENRKIEIEGVPEGYEATVKSMDTNLFSIISPRNATISASDMTLKCDVSKKSKNNTYPISVTVNNDNAWCYGTYNAVIELNEV